MKKIFLLFLIVCVTKAFGQQKAFDYAYINKKGICVYSIAEKKEYPVVTSGMNPCISPDGKKLAYTVMDSKGDRRIGVINLTTRKKTVLNTHSNNSYGPVWAPDGKHIAYNVFDNAKSDWMIALTDTNSQKPTVLTSKLKSGYMPSWCDGGKNIAIHDLDKLYVMDLAGNIIKTFDFKDLKMEMGASSADSFVFTADGKHIIYVTAADDPGSKTEPAGALFSYDIATKTVKRLSPKGYEASQFVLKNNSILFTGSKLNATVANVYSADVDGSNFKVLLLGCRDISVKE